MFVDRVRNEGYCLVAVVYILEANGAGPSYSTIGSGTFCSYDMPNPGAYTYPVCIPSAAGQGLNATDFYYSYWKHWCLKFDSGFNQIFDIRMYCDGSINWNMGSNGHVRIGTKSSSPHGCPIASYSVAIGLQGQSGYPIESTLPSFLGHPYYRTLSPAGVSTLDAYTSGSPIQIDSDSYSSSPCTCRFAVLQVCLAYNALAGIQTPETLTWTWNES